MTKGEVCHFDGRSVSISPWIFYAFFNLIGGNYCYEKDHFIYNCINCGIGSFFRLHSQ